MLDSALLGGALPAGEIVLRLALAALFGMIIGIDREAHERPAGLRTHMLVALGSAVFAVVAIEMTMSPLVNGDSVRVDPLRVLEATAAGVAFLGAGTIFRSGGSVKGVTTGASILVAGAIGAATGGGWYLVGGVALVLAMLILTVIHVVERRLLGSSPVPAPEE